ncbi:thiamine pyrophosphate-binding protein [Shewanella cyperi]|uniref:thiamine pyrophosphate-binding protein n=1 Tax=Shewanella cyperi TaxID=2814292 RepID=UPI001A940297|nr:thiamine pyrophosphate-binding protein [Shewanella cyperi]QSX39854.1 thiamine pyrophosphate-binding protein [Shewanella cyperi]
MLPTIEQNFGHAYSSQLPELGHSIARLLRFFGVERLYGVGGDFVANLINSLATELEVLPSSNEMHAGFSACAQAELAGMGVCLTTYTVGSLPCVSAAALARTEGLPVIFLSGAPGENENSGLALHHTVHPGSGWHRDLDAALNAFRALGIRAERLQGQRHSGQPNIAAEQCLELLSWALLNRQPVYIEVPRDLVYQPTQALSLPDSLATLKESQNLNLMGAELIAAEIAAKLTAASHPMVFLGEKLRLNQPLLDRLVRMCERLQLPYAVSWFAKGMVDESAPLCLGSYNGVFSGCAGQEYIDKVADYVLEIGTAILASDTNNAFASGTHRIDTHNNKTMLKGTARWERDIVAVLDALEQRADLRPCASVWCNQQQKLPQGELASTLGYANLASAINQAQKELDQGFIFIPEVGNALFASFELLALGSPLGRSFMANPWYAAMGTSLPYARAVADELRARGKQQPLLLLTGDGGFNFQANELINLQKQNANLIILYMRNNIFHLGKAGDAPIYACNDERFSPELLIRAYGGQHQSCDSQASLISALKAAAKNGGLHLLEIPTSVDRDSQSETCHKLNTYIGFKNGQPEATAAWHALCGEGDDWEEAAH